MQSCDITKIGNIPDIYNIFLFSFLLKKRKLFHIFIIICFESRLFLLKKKSIYFNISIADQV